MIATLQHGALVSIPDCYIEIPGAGRIELRVLPEISDSKSAAYNDEPVIGRSFPIKTYSHSDNRTITMRIHLVSLTNEDISRNIRHLRAIQSAVYPVDDVGGQPYLPPPVCRIRCGETLSTSPLCVVLRQYNVTFPTDVVWQTEGIGADAKLLTPLKFEVDMTWDVVYDSKSLPGNSMILSDGGE